MLVVRSRRRYFPGRASTAMASKRPSSSTSSPAGAFSSIGALRREVDSLRAPGGRSPPRDANRDALSFSRGVRPPFTASRTESAPRTAARQNSPFSSRQSQRGRRKHQLPPKPPVEGDRREEGGAKGGTRTPTGHRPHEILSLARLPIPPLSQKIPLCNGSPLNWDGIIRFRMDPATGSTVGTSVH